GGGLLGVHAGNQRRSLPAAGRVSGSRRRTTYGPCSFVTGGPAMPFKVQVGPPQISIHQGQTVLISELDGQINWPSDKGLYFLDTRLISSWAIYANGQPWQ